jgi:hypothetical protein
MRKNDHKTVHKTYLNTHGVPHCHIVMGIFFSFFIELNVNPTGHRHLSTDSPCPEAERLVTTANVTPKTTNSNSLLLNTASNYTQQHVNIANSINVQTLGLRVYKQNLITSNCR